MKSPPPPSLSEQLAQKMLEAIERRQGAKLCLDVKEVSELLSIGKSSCYSLINRGIIPSVEIGSMRRVPIGMLLEYIQHLEQTKSRWVKK